MLLGSLCIFMRLDIVKKLGLKWIDYHCTENLWQDKAKKTENLPSPQAVVFFPDIAPDKKPEHLKKCVYVYLSAYISLCQ